MRTLPEPYTYTKIEEEKVYKEAQKSENMERFYWRDYKLLAEGHYIQIYSTPNWQMLLPFSGEGALLEESHIYNTDETFSQFMDEDSDTSVPTVPDTHRD